MNKPRIGISTTILAEKDPNLIQVDRVYVNREYVSAIESAGGIPVLLPVVSCIETVREYVELCDGFLFSGGADINPRFFNSAPHEKLGNVNSEVDLCQLALMKEVLRSRKPLLAICRGMQLLNVVCGGDLFQDLSEIGGNVLQHEQHAPKYDVIHRVCFTGNSLLYNIFGKELYTNSYHHQALNNLGKGLVATGYSDDGVIEAVELQSYPFGIGVQWHPEMMLTHSDSMLFLFRELIDSLK